MINREHELKTQVIGIFNTFYKEKLEEEKTTSFILEDTDFIKMLSDKTRDELQEGTRGKFFHSKLEDEIFYKFIRRKDKFILIFMKLGGFVKGGCSSWNLQL